MSNISVAIELNHKFFLFKILPKIVFNLIRKYYDNIMKILGVLYFKR